MSKEAEIFSTPPPTASALEAAPAPPLAWQPFTFGGVAAFGRASWWRLLLAQVVAAGVVGACVAWFLAHCYSPVIAQAVHGLPDSAGITNGVLTGIPDVRISETKFLSIAATDDAGADFDQSADVQIALRKTQFEVSSEFSSALGAVEVDYPADAMLDLSRSHLEPLWGAWQPIILAGAAVGTVLVLLLVWSVLAMVYMPVAKLVAWFWDRELSWPAAWRLAAAALLPGSAVMALGILLYGGRMVDLIGLGFVTGVHFLVGWVYLLAGPVFAARLQPGRLKRNPFKP